MIKAVIFDMDGLMFDTETAFSKVQIEMSKRRGKEFTNETKRKMMGKVSIDSMKVLKDSWSSDEPLEALVRERNEMMFELCRKDVQKMEGLDELIDYLEGNQVRMCIGTAASKERVNILIDRFGLRDKFEFIVNGDMVERGKPHPDIYALCTKRLGENSENCLVLEDSLNGVKAGVAAGCKTCAVPQEYTIEEDFSEADLVVSSLADGALRDFIVGN